MINFSTIPVGTLKPGIYGEFDTRSGPRGLPANAQRLLLVGQMLTAGTKAAGVPVQIYSPADAALYWGAGSVLHRMALAAAKVSRYIEVWGIGQADAGSSTAATSTLTIAGTTASAGTTLLVNLGTDQVQVGVLQGDTPATLAARIVSTLGAIPELPITVAAVAGVVTLTAKNKGTVGNQLQLAASLVDAVGLTAAVVDFASGATDPVLQATLDAVFPERFHVVAMQSALAADLATLKTHLATVSNAIEQRGARGYVGITKGVIQADVITLATGVNQELVHVSYCPSSASAGYEIGAMTAATVAAQGDPARPYDGVPLPGAGLPAIASRLSRAQQEALLVAGVTPLEVVDGQLTIVRLVTTRTKTGGVLDLTLLDTNTMGVLFYFRDCVNTAFKVKFPQPKLTPAMLKALRHEALAVAYQLEDAEILRNIDKYKEGFLVEESTDVSGRALLRIPAPVVPGLHQVFTSYALLAI